MKKYQEIFRNIEKTSAKFFKFLRIYYIKGAQVALSMPPKQHLLVPLMVKSIPETLIFHSEIPNSKKVTSVGWFFRVWMKIWAGTAVGHPDTHLFCGNCPHSGDAGVTFPGPAQPAPAWPENPCNFKEFEEIAWDFVEISRTLLEIPSNPWTFLQISGNFIKFL